MLCLDQHPAWLQPHPSHQNGGEVNFSGPINKYLIAGSVDVQAYVLPKRALDKLVAADVHVEMLGINALIRSLAGLGREKTSPVRNFHGFHGPLLLIGPQPTQPEKGALHNRHNDPPEGMKVLLQAITGGAPGAS